MKKKSTDLIFMKDDAGFLLAIHEVKPGESAEFPSWFHYGFCIESREGVKEISNRMKSAGIEFTREYHEEADWANFYCWAPGQIKLEVSWDLPK